MHVHDTNYWWRRRKDLLTAQGKKLMQKNEYECLVPIMALGENVSTTSSKKCIELPIVFVTHGNVSKMTFATFND
jgi:hypothetical protein